MKQYSNTYYKVHYSVGSGADSAHCATLEDAELRQAEIRNNQIANGYKPDETHIYFHTWARVLSDDLQLVISEASAMSFVK